MWTLQICLQIIHKFSKYRTNHSRFTKSRYASLVKFLSSNILSSETWLLLYFVNKSIFVTESVLKYPSIRADSGFAPSHLETSLQSNAVSHWLDTNLESALFNGNIHVSAAWKFLRSLHLEGSVAWSVARFPGLNMHRICMMFNPLGLDLPGCKLKAFIWYGVNRTEGTSNSNFLQVIISHDTVYCHYNIPNFLWNIRNTVPQVIHKFIHVQVWFRVCFVQ